LKRILLAVSLAVVPVAALGVVLSCPALAQAESYRCPEDNSGSYFTGRTRTNVSGHLMKEYKCYSYGHYFWVRS
jgi:hypothetical protein